MVHIEDWIKANFLQFEGESFAAIDLINLKALPNPDNFNFNTELNFINCKIESFNAATLVVGKKITFTHCTIGFLQCHATCFCEGFSLVNSSVGGAQFDCGGHNKNSSQFLISKCQFDDYVDFDDIYFEGPVEITENNFRKGTNLVSNLKVPYGIKEGISLLVEKNQGQLEKRKHTSPGI